MDQHNCGHKYSRVIKCSKVNNYEYELKLNCGHIVIRRVRPDRKSPKVVICKQCWYETHDKHGNKI